MGGEFAVGVEACVNLLENQRAGQSPASHCKFLRLEILNEGKREESSVAIVGQDSLITHMNFTAKESLGKGDLLVGEAENLRILPVERRGELKGQIVAQPALGEWIAVAVGDLAAGGGDAELERSRLLLSLPGRLRIFIDRAYLRCLPAAGERGGRQEKGKQESGAEIHRGGVGGC